ncbi:MAG TPA: IS200/IS605 family transposase [Candidatus Latescibacteria bacterium]|jgi:REP element-mobilizing transposase RayT|nr:IS200/IS605 family transposase [Candidatus Latescibacterota bacterium]HOT35308.1 IS200/IS605 family transposase [Candidatus Latescibacterota bacterium]HPK74694.1 IS200/IS605 family transposase [Candidatus Latescibacterota bacterium]HQK76522.1 IS200/IS605 family transposase [Candidatus Hydrogenedentota bacterium]HRS93918.1 IS200/IS605 family transposase [Candidatus Latescibacterota bacterium]
MPQSLARILVHVVFSTQNREPVLNSGVRNGLFPYCAAVLNENGCSALAVGGVEDHMHLLFALGRTATVCKVVEMVKTSSSKWVKRQGEELAAFYWQGGYGAFSVSPTHAQTVVRYIARQEIHHRTRSFQDEFRGLLRRYSLDFEEERVWE